MKSLRILVVEDDLHALRSIDIALKEAGYETRLAENGKVGLEFAAEFQPDIVITDVLMPEKDGYELIMGLRRMQSQAGIIAMSSGGKSGFMRSDIGQILRLFKVTTFLNKPVDPQQLLEAVHREAESLERIA